MTNPAGKEREEKRHESAEERQWIAKAAWEGEKARVGWFVLFKKKLFGRGGKSLEWICTCVEDNQGFLLFVLGIETKKWRL